MAMQLCQCCVGDVLGVAALVVIGAGLLGRSLLVANRRQAVFVVLGIIVVKVALTALHSRICGCVRAK